jgi:hypothetical protein
MKPAKPVKLTRAQVKAGIEQTPIENILLGSLNADKVRLTKKQKDFAKAVALGKPKAKAYRETYDSNASPQSQAEQASRLSKNPKISAMIESFQVANEAREYLIPAQIRTMAIQNLVSIAINDGEKTSNKLKALELIGKMSEVSLFSETKTHVHLHSSDDIKTQLLEGLRQAFTNSRGLNDLAKRKAESLLIELSEARTIESDQDNGATPSETDEPDDPPHPDPQISTNSELKSMHSIPLKESSSQASVHSLLADLTPPADEVTNTLESDTCVSIGVNPDASNAQIEGVPLSNSGQPAPEVPRETPPLTNPIEKG